MGRSNRDPLLTAAKVVLRILQGLSLLGIAVMAVAAGALLTVGRAQLLAEIARVGSPDSTYWGLAGVLILTGALFFLGLRFVSELKRIVDSVERNDAFDPRNADRLTRMAWMVVIAHGLALVGSAIAAFVEDFGRKTGGHVEFDFGLDGSGVLLILVLFILARVFRVGTAMREDLEGTV